MVLNKMNQPLGCLIKVFFVLQITAISLNSNAQKSVKGFQIHDDSGFFEIKDKETGANLFSEITAGFSYDGKFYLLTDLVSESMIVSETKSTFGKGMMLTWKLLLPSKKMRFALELISYPDNNWLTINGWVQNLSSQKIILNAIQLFNTEKGILAGENQENWRVLCGSTDKLLWTGEALTKEKNAINARLTMGLWNSKSNLEAVMGYSIKHAWGTIKLTKSNLGINLLANVDLDLDLQPGEKGYAEALHLKVGPVLESMEELVLNTGKEVGARTDGTSFGGWCSWYGFNPFIDNDVTEDAVVGFAQSAAKKRDELPLQLMLLDDGYFTLPGDWTTLRPFFPHGMKYLSEEVKKNGIIPGIWIAPSIVHKNSEIIKRHPEWVDRRANGKPNTEQINWGGLTYSFDVSNPAVLNHIDSIFKVVCGEWGYQYLKLDFNIEPGPLRYNRSITSFEAMRNMYRTIRKAVGPEVFIANCSGSPFSPSIGIAQAGRVGPDVNPNWESVINGCRQSLLHIPYHRRWWVNDPDCLNMRKIGSKLTDEELRAHITANFMGGGYVLFSDSLDRLPVDRRIMLSQALPSYGIAAHPVNYMKSPGIGIPNILNLPIEKHGEKYSIVSIFNWEDKNADTDLKLQELGLDPNMEYHVFDFWTDTYKGIIKDAYHLKGQKPHSCELLAIKPVLKGEIQVVSTNLHLLQGTLEITDIKRMNTSPFDKAKAEIWISLKPVSLRNGKLVLSGGEGLRIAAMQGGIANLVKRSDGLWDLNVSELKDQVAILLRER
jgi:hypothetical protein